MAYYFHWDYTDILNLEHRDRQRWCQEISRINKQLNGEEEKSFFEV